VISCIKLIGKEFEQCKHKVSYFFKNMRLNKNFQLQEQTFREYSSKANLTATINNNFVKYFFIKISPKKCSL